MRLSPLTLSVITTCIWLPSLVCANTSSSSSSTNAKTLRRRRLQRGGAGRPPNTLAELYDLQRQQESGNGDGGQQQEEDQQEEDSAGITTPPPPPPSNGFSSPSSTCPNKVFTDVIIVGAGMAGVSAAASLQERGVDYVIVESTDRVGGRVRSHSFGVEGNTWTVEDGANWIYEFKDNPILDMMNENELVAPFNDYNSFLIYGKDVSTTRVPHHLRTCLVNDLTPLNLLFLSQGQLVEQSVWQERMDMFNEAWAAAEAEADDSILWSSESDSYVDNGVKSLLAKHGWSLGDDEQSDLDYIFQWFILDWYVL